MSALQQEKFEHDALFLLLGLHCGQRPLPWMIYHHIKAQKSTGDKEYHKEVRHTETPKSWYTQKIHYTQLQALAVEEQMIDGEEQEDQVERKRKIMEKAYVKTAEEVLGYKQKKNKPWFSQEAWTLVDQRKAIKQKLIGAKSERLKQRWTNG